MINELMLIVPSMNFKIKIPIIVHKKKLRMTPLQKLAHQILLPESLELM